jgi:hypothetical protein
MGRTSKPYTFAGTEREVRDPGRCRRALQAWDGYVLQQQVEERAQRDTKPRRG